MHLESGTESLKAVKNVVSKCSMKFTCGQTAGIFLSPRNTELCKYPAAVLSPMPGLLSDIKYLATYICLSQLGFQQSNAE